MRTIIAAVITLTLTGCLSGGSNGALEALKNLEHCDRAYTVALGMGASGALNITCRARPYEAAPAVTQ